MTLTEFFNKLKNGARWDVGVSINRSNALPLDANSVFKTLEDAQNYAAGNPAEALLLMHILVKFLPLLLKQKLIFII